MTQALNQVVILGGGTAGWMTAALLSKTLTKLDITVVESDQIGTIGVGEATIPSLHFFNDMLGIRSTEFVKKTSGSFKLGIQFENWHKQGESYFHGFGGTGLGMWAAGFHEYWKRGLELGISKPFGTYNAEGVAALQNKFAHQDGLNFAYHLDASLYAKMLRQEAQNNGVTRVEGLVDKVHTDDQSGFITALALQDGQKVEADFYVDCSGFKGLLIEEALNTGYEHWGHWLPCDRAVVAPSKNVADPVPYTRSTAHGAGWQWRIPLQHRTGNGHVYSSRFMSDDEAKQTLLDNIEGQVLAEPRVVKFTTGTRRKHWNKNCVAIGLSSGFIEPLESTSIHLIQSSISRLMSLFPDKSFEKSVIDTFNSQTKLEVERIRDFIILHYKVTEREDTEFWRYCKNMEVPAYLEQKIKLFSQTGRIFRQDDELFNQSSWLAVMLGQGITPEAYHPLVDNLSLEEIRHRCDNIKKVIKESVERMPKQSEFINKFCRANLESV